MPIKALSPDLIVLPLLPVGEYEARNKFLHWVKMMRAVSIGSGLGRDLALLKDFGFILESMKEKPTVGDADFFWFISQDLATHKQSLKNFKRLVLTPNIVEFSRLFKLITNRNFETAQIDELLSQLAGKDEIVEVDLLKKLDDLKQFFDFFENKNLCVVLKYKSDLIITEKSCFVVRARGAPKRVGGQGDVLTGLCLYFSELADSKGSDFADALVFASFVARKAAREAFRAKKLGMLASDVLEHIPTIVNHFLDDFYERELSDSFNSFE